VYPGRGWFFIGVQQVYWGKGGKGAEGAKYKVTRRSEPRCVGRIAHKEAAFRILKELNTQGKGTEERRNRKDQRLCRLEYHGKSVGSELSNNWEGNTLKVTSH